MDFRNRIHLSLGIRNNNPGNLRPGHDWVGMVGENKGFIVYESIEYGLRALAMDITNKILRGLNTIETMIPVYAPALENNVGAYKTSVSVQTGFFVKELLELKHDTIFKLVKAICRHENGELTFSFITDELIYSGMLLMPEPMKARFG